MAPKKRRAAKSARKSAPKAPRAPKAPPAPKMVHVRAKGKGTYGATLYEPGDVFLIEKPAKGQELPDWVEAMSDKEVKEIAEKDKARAKKAEEAAALEE